jgi:hypothetical protein
MNLLNKYGNITDWYNKDNYSKLFDTEADYIIMIGPEHHRDKIFNQKFNISKNGKKVIGILYESIFDPFGYKSWKVNGYPWLSINYGKCGVASKICYSQVGVIEQFKSFDYIFTQDEVDMKIFNSNGLNSFFLPACVDTQIFKPTTNKPNREAGFVGNPWWPRNYFIKNYKHPLKIMTTPRQSNKDYESTKRATETLVSAFSSFLINFNLRSPFAGISMRTFEIMACARYPLIFQPAPDRKLYYKLFKDIPMTFINEWSPQSIKKTREVHDYYLSHYDEAIKLGLKCRNLIESEHTPKHRINEILSRLKSK